jgi:hypothetical protein
MARRLRRFHPRKSAPRHLGHSQRLAGFHLSRTERNELLKDTLCWAIGADLIEGFPELDDDLFNQMIIPVYLADTGKRAALRAGGGSTC